MSSVTTCEQSGKNMEFSNSSTISRTKWVCQNVFQQFKHLFKDKVGLLICISAIQAPFQGQSGFVNSGC